MNVKLKRLLLPLLRAAAKGAPPTFRMRSAASQALFLIGKHSSKKVSGRLRRNSEKQSSRASHNQETAKIREEVMKRADGSCECGCGRVFAEEGSLRAELDHWKSGIGRRREQQAVSNTWALARWCHWRRTRHVPSAEHWNELFARHCAKHDYNFEGHIIHAEPAKAGGAP